MLQVTLKTPMRALEIPSLNTLVLRPALSLFQSSLTEATRSMASPEKASGGWFRIYQFQIRYSRKRSHNSMIYFRLAKRQMIFLPWRSATWRSSCLASGKFQILSSYVVCIFIVHFLHWTGCTCWHVNIAATLYCIDDMMTLCGLTRSRNLLTEHKSTDITLMCCDTRLESW